MTIRLTTEGVYWLLAITGLALIGLNRNINLILLLACFLVAVLFLNMFLAWRRVSLVRAWRSPSPVVFAHEPFLLEIEAQASGLPLLGCELVDSGDDYFATWPLPLATTGTKFQAELRLPRRGLSVGEPLRAECRFPFGLVKVSRPVAEPLSVVVFPRLGRVHAERIRQWLARASRGDGRAHRLNRPTAAHGADLHGLRVFRLGDSPRWIHWRTSARRGELMIRECEEPLSLDLTLIVEPFRDQSTSAELESVLSLAASICWEWSRHPGEHFSMILATAQPTIQTGSTSLAYGVRLLESLALLPGSQEEPAVEPIAEHVRAVGLSTPVMVLSSRPRSRLAEQLSRQLGRPIPLAGPEVQAMFYLPPTSDSEAG